MQFARAVAVVGSAIHAPRDAKQRSLEEAMYAVAKAALVEIGLKVLPVGWRHMNNATATSNRVIAPSVVLSVGSTPNSKSVIRRVRANDAARPRTAKGADSALNAARRWPSPALLAGSRMSRGKSSAAVAACP